MGHHTERFTRVALLQVIEVIIFVVMAESMDMILESHSPKILVLLQNPKKAVLFFLN